MPTTINADKLLFGFIKLSDRERSVGMTTVIMCVLGWFNYIFFNQLNEQHENEVKRLIEQDKRKDKKIERLENELMKAYDFRNSFYLEKINKVDSLIQHKIK